MSDTTIQHTQGTWDVTPNLSAVYDEQGTVIAIMSDEITSISEHEANVRLIAAAPELLAELQRLAFEAERRAGVPRSFITRARAIIAKAKGGAA